MRRQNRSEKELAKLQMYIRILLCEEHRQMSGNTTIDLNYSGGEHSALQSLRTAQESPQGGDAAVSSVSSSAKVIISWQTQPVILTFF